MDIFISYSHVNEHFVKNVLSADLMKVNLGYDVWYDRNLQGGEDWWNEILAKIRQADFFVCVLSDNYLESQACTLERIYAEGLNKRIIPVNISEKSPNDLRLPPEIHQKQIIDYRDHHSGLVQLLPVLKENNKSPELPKTLPKQPSPPRDPFKRIEDLLDKRDLLSYDQQHSMVSQLESLLSGSKEDEKFAEKLLISLRQRREVDEWISAKISTLLNPNDVLLFGFFWASTPENEDLILVRRNKNIQKSNRLPIISRFSNQEFSLVQSMEQTVQKLMDKLGITTEKLVQAHPQKPQLMRLYKNANLKLIPYQLYFFYIKLESPIMGEGELWDDGEYSWLSKHEVLTQWREPAFEYGVDDEIERKLPQLGNIYSIINYENLYPSLGGAVLEGADMIVFRRTGDGNVDFLLIRRAKHQLIGANKWEYCKGGVYYCESPKDAALREIREEMGIRREYLGHIETLGEQTVFVKRNTVYNILRLYGFAFEYVANQRHDFHVDLDVGHSEYKWVSYDEAVKEVRWLENGYGVRFFERFKQKYMDK